MEHLRLLGYNQIRGRQPITAASTDSSSQIMDKILVHGGRKLSGSVNISGSKNSALPILAATLLTKEECVIHHVPDLSDVHYMLQILDHLGAQVERASGTVTVKAEKVTTERAVRGRPQNARLGMRARAAAGARKRGDRLAARRLRHRRPPHRFAPEGLRGARRPRSAWWEAT